MDCIDCHAGETASGDFGDYASVHENVVADPSMNPDICLACHENSQGNLAAVDGAAYKQSLHVTLGGYRAAIETRCSCDIENDAEAQAGFGRNCASCHATCGECHVSRPRSVGGGFLMANPAGTRSSRHAFNQRPHMTEQCTACHGSRIFFDYFGDPDGDPARPADYHWGHLLKQCTYCHSRTEIHGDGESYEHRYEVAGMPRCEICHDGLEDVNEFHEMHWGQFQCQVCHSRSYKNCTNCHLDPTDFTIDESTLQLKIAKNTLSPGLRDYEYTVVRHVPVARDTYENWGLSGLPGFDEEPTWKYASPHNIQPLTERTSLDGQEPSCVACHNWSEHGLEDPFLRDSDLVEGDSQANFEYTVDLESTVEAGIPPELAP